MNTYSDLLSGNIQNEPERHQLYKLLLDRAEFIPKLIENPETDSLAIWNGLKLPSQRKWEFGMTTTDEQAYCEWYASHLYTGEGSIVELGSFLGSLAKSLAKGLKANRFVSEADSKYVDIFDLFIWDFIMVASVKNTPFEGRVKEGDDFQDLYRECVGEEIDRIRMHKSDLCVQKWSAEPIEFLLVDAMKYPKLVRNIQNEFFPALIPGKGVLFHQDYLHFYESWVTVTMYLMRDYFQPLGEVLGNYCGSFLFRLIKPLDRKALFFPESCSDLPAGLIKEAFDWSRSIVGKDAHHFVGATETMMYYHAGYLDHAKESYKRAIHVYPESYALREMSEYLKNNRSFDLAQ